LLLGFYVGCVDPYEPEEITEFGELVVIDANVNGTTGEASVVLTTSRSLNGEDTLEYISGADVYLQTEAGLVYNLPFSQDGTYSADNVLLQFGDKIRLHVNVSETRQYVSDFEEYLRTPEIDSVTYRADADGVKIFVSTHDANNNTFYYKWDYLETWIFSAAYQSLHVYETNATGNLILSSITNRQPAELDSMRFCFKDYASKQIIVGTSENLGQDIISNRNIFDASYAEGKFQYRYSVLVRQNALTKRSFEYWTNLSATTEGLGGFFDTQPANFESNIKNSLNPGEIVLGYFNVFSETEKRIFIDATDVPEHETSETLNDICGTEDLLKFDPQVGNSPLAEQINGRYILVEKEASAVVATAECSDCRLTGYYETPEFWED
jgi:hypothetical protein